MSFQELLLKREKYKKLLEEVEEEISKTPEGIASGIEYLQQFKELDISEIAKSLIGFREIIKKSSSEYRPEIRVITIFQFIDAKLTIDFLTHEYHEEIDINILFEHQDGFTWESGTELNSLKKYEIYYPLLELLQKKVAEAFGWELIHRYY